MRAVRVGDGGGGDIVCGCSLAKEVWVGIDDGYVDYDFFYPLWLQSRYQARSGIRAVRALIAGLATAAGNF